MVGIIIHKMDHNADIRIQFLVFYNLASFSKAIEAGEGFTFDFASLTTLPTNSILSSEQHLILNIRASNNKENDNLLFLTEHEAFLYTKKAPDLQASMAFDDIITKPFGRSIVLAFLTLKEVLDSHKHKLEELIIRIKELEQNLKPEKNHDLISEFKSAEDGLEDFHDLVIKLQAANIKGVQTRYISFDYSKLINESLSLLARCQFRYQIARELGRIEEMQTIIEMNKNIEKLNTDMRRLTAVIVPLVLATLVVSQLSIYFAYRAMLNMSWVYPIVVISLIVIAAVCVMILIRKTDYNCFNDNLRQSKQKKS